MIVSSSQNIQSSNPLDTSSPRRVNNISRATNIDSEDKEAEKLQRQENDNILRQLRARDREVRAHEAAHTAAGGSLVRGGPSYTFQTGPDGRSYAVGGEVQLDVSAVPNNPQATLAKASQIRAAALAPANPSAQDVRVAANANQLASRARIDLAVQRREEIKLEENQEQLDNLQNDSNNPQDVSSTSATEGVQPDNSASPSTVVPASTGVQSTNLRSNEPPAAAISAFMATAQTEAAPVLFNQFA
ncbi:MAG: putative metalloprotease CJM1_0395 family protein [Gammaproteobacteria bacterium]|nr:putative metalloprotease CJM1_0395 family protein [Gammaproteobacteria bacterium]